MNDLLTAFILGGPEDGRDVRVSRHDERHERGGVPYRIEVRTIYDHGLNRDVTRLYAIHPELDAR